MKEDAQLVCPVGYDDPSNIWALLESDFASRLPIKDVTWKSPLSSVSVTIPLLPLRFLPSSSNLFKDSDHPFRWFLAAYVHVYIVSVQTLDAYKGVKPVLKAWVESHSGLKRASWLLLFVPVTTTSSLSSSSSLDTFSKIFSKLSSDFCVEKSGDRSVMFIPSSTFSSNGTYNSSAAIDDFFAKIRDGVVTSFQQRTSLYDADIRRLDSMRGTPHLDFRQLFLVKESLALMHQMMQLPAEALMQYEELEALLAFVPTGQFPETMWPMVVLEGSKAPQSSTSSKKSGEKSTPTDSSGSSGSPRGDAGRERDVWSDACKQGDEVLLYSINIARMRLLKNKMDHLELLRYVFARQIFFLALLDKPIICATKALTFIVNMRKSITNRISLAYENDGTDYSSASLGDKVLSLEQLRNKQADAWIIVASIRIALAIRELAISPIVLANELSNTTSSSDNTIIDSSSNQVINIMYKAQMGSCSSSIEISSSRLGMVKEASRLVCDLVRFAVHRYRYLINNTIGRSSLNITNDINDETILYECDYQKASLHIAQLFSKWNDTCAVEQVFPSLILSSGLSSQYSISDKTTPLKVVIDANVTPSQDSYSKNMSDKTPTRYDTVKDWINTTVSNITHFDDFNQQIASSIPQRLRSMLNNCFATISSYSYSRPADVESAPASSNGNANGVCIRISDKGKALQTLIYSILLRLQSEFEQLCSRSRFEAFTKIASGDSMLCNGFFQAASVLYNEGLSLLCKKMNGSKTFVSFQTPLLNEAMLSATPKKGNIRISNNVNTINSCPVNSNISKLDAIKMIAAANKANQSSGDDSVQHIIHCIHSNWASCRYWPLRKLLVCSRYTNDCTLFCQVALQLLEPSLVAYHLSKQGKDDFCCELLADILAITSGRMNVNGFIEGNRAIDSPNNFSTIHVNLKPFFEVDILYDENDDGHTSSLAEKLVADETFPVRIIGLDAGKPFYFKARVTSKFPSDIAIDSIVMTYQTFSIDTMLNCSDSDDANGDNADEDTKTKRNRYSFATESNRSFDCYPNSLFEKILRPGQQIVTFCLEAPSIGEYKLVRIKIVTGNGENNITFQNSLLTNSLSDINDYFTSHSLLSFRVPSDVLNVVSTVPRLSPLHQSDSVAVTLTSENNDFVNNVSILLDEFFEVRSSDDENDTDRSPPNPPTDYNILFDPSSNWHVTKRSLSDISNDSVDPETSPGPPEKLNIFGFGLAATEINVIAPFKVVVMNNSRNLPSESTVKVKITISGTVTRNKCTIPFEKVEVFAIRVIDPLSVVSAAATVRDGKCASPSTFFNQVAVMNVSEYPLILISSANNCGSCYDFSHSGANLDANEEYSMVFNVTIKDFYTTAINALTEGRSRSENILSVCYSRFDTRVSQLNASINDPKQCKFITKKRRDIHLNGNFYVMIPIKSPTIDQLLLTCTRVTTTVNNGVKEGNAFEIVGRPIELEYNLHIRCFSGTLLQLAALQEQVKEVTINSISLSETGQKHWALSGHSKRVVNKTFYPIPQSGSHGGNSVDVCDENYTFGVIPVMADEAAALPLVVMLYTVLYQNSSRRTGSATIDLSNDTKCIAVNDVFHDL